MTSTLSVQLADVVLAVSKLVTTDGKILIPGLMDLVAPLTDEERKRYEVINASIKVCVLTSTRSSGNLTLSMIRTGLR